MTEVSIAAGAGLAASDPAIKAAIARAVGPSKNLMACSPGGLEECNS